MVVVVVVDVVGVHAVVDVVGGRMRENTIESIHELSCQRLVHLNFECKKLTEIKGTLHNG